MYIILCIDYVSATKYFLGQYNIPIDRCIFFYCNSPSCHQTCLCQVSPYHSCYIVPLSDQLSLDRLELCQLDLHLIIYASCCVGQVNIIDKNGLIEYL